MASTAASGLRVNARRFLRAIRDPSLGFAYLARGDRGVQETLQARFAAEVIGVHRRDALRLARDLVASGYQEEVLRRRGGDYVGEIDTGTLLYVLCRLLAPDHVVETGVASGTSSAYILRALADNGRGHLDSIDLPNYEETLVQTRPEVYRAARALVAADREVGWAVPPALRGRWSLHIGSTKDLLPQVMEAAGTVALFLHDSEHTYETMMFEYRTAWPHLRKGGILLSDDANWNAAFSEFAASVGSPPHIHAARLGALRKMG